MHYSHQVQNCFLYAAHQTLLAKAEFETALLTDEQFLYILSQVEATLLSN